MTQPIKMKKARLKLKLTQIDVASECGVSVAAYRLWEKGGTKPSAQNEKKLRKALKLGANDEPTAE